MTTGTPAQALVLTAGIGRRLRPLSDVRAKPAVPVAGEPLVRRVLRWLAGQGVRDAVLNLHHRPQSITRVVGDGTDLGIRVRYAWEPRLLGSAGGPRAMMTLVEPAPTLIVNGDTLTDMAIEKLAGEHRRCEARVTLAVIDHPGQQGYGGVITDREGWVRGFVPAGHDGPSLHFVGIQLVEPDVFQAVRSGERASTIGGLYTEMVSSGRDLVRAHRVGGRFLDVGTPTDYLATSLTLAAEEGVASLTNSRSRIDVSARLVRTAIWDDVVVDAGCELTDCVVTDGVHVDAGTQLTGQILIRGGQGNQPKVVPLAHAGPSATEGRR